MENPVGLRHYLSGLGLNIPRDSRRRAGSATVSAGWNALLYRRNRTLRVDASEGHSLAYTPRVGGGFFLGSADLRVRLRRALLG